MNDFYPLFGIIYNVKWRRGRREEENIGLLYTVALCFFVLILEFLFPILVFTGRTHTFQWLFQVSFLEALPIWACYWLPLHTDDSLADFLLLSLLIISIRLGCELMERSFQLIFQIRNVRLT